MADEGGDKTEPPTARRRQEARDAGQIARSPDLSAAALLIGILYLLQSFGSPILNSLKMALTDFLSGHSLADLDLNNVAAQVVRSTVAVAIAMAPLLAGIVFIGIVVNLLQVGLNLNFNRISPNLGALNPIQGLTRLLGSSRVVVKMGMNFLKVIFVSLTAYSAVHGHIIEILGAQNLSFIQIFSLGSGIVFAIALRIGFLLLFLALLDYGYQWRQLENDLKMSKQEVKEEMRSMDGDPKIKMRRRQLALQRHVQWLKKEVPKADVVITNPTHFAIALKYDSTKMHAPRVVAKGQDLIAQRIREIAIGSGIPLVERPTVARALYKMCDVGDEIPEEFYSAVAEILAYVYQLSQGLRRAG
jgi:flagellar biosynthetic protein FlhB